MAGGPECETELEVFEFVHDGMQNGAIGVNLGRNVWKNAHPVAMIQALNAVIHAGAPAAEGEPGEALRAGSSRTGELRMSMMRVAMYYNNRDVRLEEMPVPAIGPGECWSR